MKPAWDQLGDEFKDSATVIIADVDCTVEKKLCSQYDVKGFPTIKYFADGDTDGQAYEGGRDFDSLKTFASENLGPSCSSENKDLCSAEQLKELEELEGLGKEEVEKRIAEGKAAVKAAEEKFETELKALQETYEKISKEKDETISAAKKPLGMLKKVKFA
jgi:protein disulfide-isomerase A6